jgi:hypothetical protein
MARGNQIIVTSEPKGQFRTVFIAAGQTPKPGTILQLDPSVALQSGLFTAKIYDRAADGDRPAGPICVLLDDPLQGKLTSTAYAAGEIAKVYHPLPGDELNCLLLDVAGTADDHALGEILMVDDGTGKLIATTGTPQSAPFQLNEAITDPVADTLAWVTFGGY